MIFLRTAFHIPLICCLALIIATRAADASAAEPVPHLTMTQPGGMPGWPVITSVDRATNGMTVHWEGPPGYYRLFQKKGVQDKNWTQVGTPMLGRQATITTLSSNAFFRISGPSPRYAGSQVCGQCHTDVHNNAMHTRHAEALQTLKQIGQDKNASCLPCHTVGHGLPTGFTSELATPNLAGVQCENCHGPSANHAANEEDITLRPRKDIAAQVCGGCHTDSHHPTYDEFSGTGHANVTEDMSLVSRVDSCGRCHSGSARLTMLKGNSALSVTNDANMGITCVVCHDPHSNTVNPSQLRNPLASTNDFFLSTSGSFASAYREDVNVCAQCHNHRGASFTSSGRPPHHSPQYNMLIGTVGELSGGTKPNQAGAHARLIEKQCVGCHMATEEYVSEAQPAMTGHSFRVETFNSCAECHPFPELLTVFTTFSVSNQVQQLKQALDLWATTKASAALRTKYGARAWEYTTPGSLSSGGPGPSAAEQAQIPINIQKARFNLYIVQYDGSFGVHNGPYAITLLDAARAWIQAELNN
ncbi:MAG TPA: multiheme c-type cytochrome [Verrucomicrobiae bacterium]|nr:multiheme c-type cytochrome [Verrucomicrobiae bacterium]